MTTRRLERPEVAAACVTCPFRRANFGKDNPNGYVPDLEAGGEDWYAEANLRRIWEGLKTEHWLMCHSSDPTATDYGGALHSPGKERICAGELVAVMKHLKLFEKLLLEHPDERGVPYRLYKKEAGRAALKFETIVQLVMAVSIGRTHMFGGLPFPLTATPETEAAVGLPWADPVVNGGAE